jgi:hypothetical protein
MSVIVTARLGRVEPTRTAPRLLDVRDVVFQMKPSGCLHHHVLELEDEWWLIQEWESSDVFERFFDSTPEFRNALREAGFSELSDDVTLWSPIKSEDEPYSVTVGPGGRRNGAT